jgi:hypothetical protein
MYDCSPLELSLLPLRSYFPLASPSVFNDGKQVLAVAKEKLVDTSDAGWRLLLSFSALIEGGEPGSDVNF